MKKPLPSRAQSYLEILAIAAPAICLVHCIGGPVLLGLLPLCSSTHCANGLCEQLLTGFILVICLLSIIPAYLKHKKAHVLFLLFLGLSCVLGAGFAEQFLGSIAHTTVIVSGSVFLITANLQNRKYTRGCCATHNMSSHMREAILAPDSVPIERD